MALCDGMTGKDLAEQLRARSSDFRIAFTSGYSADFVEETLAATGGFHFLQKPFCPQALSTMVRECLDQTVCV
jgi:FixJ family two-component response regulator